MEKNYKKEIVKQIDELLQQASEEYCSYCDYLEDLRYNPNRLLEPIYIERVQNLVKAIEFLINQVNLLLSILFEEKDKKLFRIDATEDLQDYLKTRRMSISYRKTIEDIHSFEVRTHYMFYDAKTGKLKELH